MYKKFFKRLIDIFISLCGIIILFIPMLVISLFICVDSRGPILFCQKRLGRNKKEFTILKFRTMCDCAYEIGGIVSSEHDSRITKVGKFLRKTSLDEIPQLFNIFIGDMSIIGPRPILDWEYNNNAKEEYEDRFKARPGLFCTVDLDYRATASRDIQFGLDVQYVNNISLINDIFVFWGVFLVVLCEKNVYKDEKDIDTNIDVRNKEERQSVK